MKSLEEQDNKINTLKNVLKEINRNNMDAKLIYMWGSDYEVAIGIKGINRKDINANKEVS